MTRNIEIEVSILEKSWDLHGLINTCKSDKILRDFFYSGNKRNSEFRELLWANTHGDVIGLWRMFIQQNAPVPDWIENNNPPSRAELENKSIKK